MPSSRGEQIVIWLTIMSLGSAILRKLGKLVGVVYRVATKIEDVLDWVLALKNAFPDEIALITKLKKLNGHDKSKAAAGEGD